MPEGKEKFAYSFQAGSDGDGPSGPVIVDKAGNIYGTTMAGGGSGCNGGGCGTVFNIVTDWSESVLYAFQGGNDGDGPQNGVIEDSAGNFYGTTEGGGVGNSGTVFKLTPTGTETVLYAFRQAAGGFAPEAGLIMDRARNLYGTTYYGDGTSCKGAGCGTVFKLRARRNRDSAVRVPEKARPESRRPAAVGGKGRSLRNNHCRRRQQGRRRVQSAHEIARRANIASLPVTPGSAAHPTSPSRF